jgi:hypothetical protein
MERKRITIGYSTEDSREPSITLEIELKAGTLSICGNIGRDQCGQCQDSIKELMIGDNIKYQNGWTKTKLAKVLKVWDEWHLNDMHPECEHQAKDGTLEEARQEVTLYGYTLKSEVSSQQRAIKDRTEKDILENRSARITEGEQELLKLEYWIKSLDAVPPVHYIETKDGYNSTEKKTRGWIDFAEFPSVGVMSRPCATCGYKYGTAWKKVELPKEVVDFVKSL